LSGTQRLIIKITVALVIVFVCISIILAVVYGGKKGEASYFVMAIGLFGWMMCVVAMLWWINKGTLEDTYRTFMGLQLGALLFLAIGVLVVVVEKQKTCDVCPPPLCDCSCQNHLQDFVTQSTCFGTPQNCCFKEPACFLATVPPPSTHNKETNA